MCARRFLVAIFWLTLLVVGGAFAFHQFGGSVLTRMATPGGHFVAPVERSGPDYKQTANWLARPGLSKDPSNWVPIGLTQEAQNRRAAVFYIHPTTFLPALGTAQNRWNAALDEGGDTAFRDRLFVQSQASAFNGVGEVWAPRYRQAALGAFLLTSKDANEALDLAYRDVLAAFDTFLAAQPKDRPIILAGHSQGGLHLSRLLIDRRAALGKRLVAAYVGGWPLSVTADLQRIGRPACTAPAQSGCVLSWLSFGEPANASMILDNWVGTSSPDGIRREQRDLLCVNPLTGTRNGAAPPDLNPGTLVPTADFTNATLLAGTVGARCADGLLMIGGSIPPLGPYVLPGNNYHVYDYALFWSALRADAARRLAAWR